MFFYDLDNANACQRAFTGKLNAGTCALYVYVLDSDGVDRGATVPEMWRPGCSLVLHPYGRGGVSGHMMEFVSQTGDRSPVARFVEDCPASRHGRISHVSASEYAKQCARVV